MKTSQIAVLTTRDVAALTTDQVSQGLTTAQVAALTTAQVAQGLTTEQVSALTTAQVAQGLTTRQVAALTTAQISQGLTTDQIVALTTRDIAALTTTQVNQGLNTDQIQALTTTQIRQGLTTVQISQALSTDQVVALTEPQVISLTNAQINAFATDNIQYLTLGTPLVLDLSGAGIQTQSITAGTKFDLFATGQAINTGWVTGSSGLLVMDRNNDGVINNGAELFGEATALANGEKAANGYIALTAQDSSGDGLITRADTGWSSLKVWVDANGDGVSQAVELKTLDSLGITQMSLAATASTETNNGNVVGLVSSFQMSDGATHAMADVWFAVNKNSAAPATASGLAPADALSSKVSGLAEALGNFNVGTLNTAQSTLPATLQGVPPPSAPTVAVGSVVSAVNALNQFDPNGKLLVATQSAAAVPTLTPTSLPNPVSNGILANGK